MPLYCCFVDFSKAYDRVPRAHLFSVFVRELGVAPGLVKCIRRMYEEVRASVWVDGDYTVPFTFREGVR